MDSYVLCKEPGLGSHPLWGWSYRQSRVSTVRPLSSHSACDGIQEAEGKDEPPARCAFKGAPEEEGSTPAPVCSARVDDLRAYVCRPLGQEGRTNLVSQSASNISKQHKSTPSYSCCD